ncbi:MAG: DUF167 family protein [Actinomycetota bacterium]|nr:DUF167 family protein [Actinomycetota bacterium]
MAWVEESGGQVVLKVWLQPKASRDAVVGIYDDALKIKVTSPPVEGQANEQLVAALSKWLSIPKSKIKLRSGQTGRRKALEISGLSVVEIQQRLGL